MRDQDKTKQQLIEELTQLRGRMAAQEAVDAGRKRAEEELRKSEAKWRSLVGNIPLFTAIVDRSGKIEFHNDTYQPGHTPESVIGRVVYDFIQPEYRDLARESLDRVFNTGKSTFYESVGSGPNGTLSSYEVHISPIIVDNEVVVAALMSRDITPRKRAEEALRQSAQRLSLYFQQTPLAAIEWDVHGRVTKWNPCAERLFGYTEEEALGRHAAFIVPPNVRDHTDFLWDALPTCTGGDCSTKENITKDGQTILCEWHSSPLVDADGKIIGTASLAEDITKRKTAEEQLRQSEARYRMLAEFTPDIVYILDETGTLLYANRTAAMYVGVTPAALVGKTQQDLFPPGLVPRHVAHIQRVLETGEMEETEELYRFNSQDVWLNIRLIPLRDEHGRVSSVMGVCRNITARKEAERELAKSKSILRAAVECLPFDFFAIGEDGCYFMENAACRANWGELVGKAPEEMAPAGAVRALWLDSNRRAFAGEMVENEAAVTIRGQERFVRNILTPIRDGTQSYGILGVNIDITQRKRAEDALRKAHDELEQRIEERTAELREAYGRLQREVEERRRAETTLDAFFSASTALLNILDDEFRYIKTDSLTPTYFGLDAQSIVGRSLKDDLAPQFIKEYGPMIRRVSETGEPVHNVEVRGEVPGRPREIVYWRASYFPVTLPEGRRGIGVVGIEINDVKRAETALRQSHEQLRTIYDSMVEGILITDIETKRIRRVNSSFCRMLGYGEEELLTKSIPDLHPPEEVTNDLQRFQAAAEGRVSINEDRPVLKKDGSLFYADITGRRILYEGRPCLLALFRDITERKQAQEALQREHQTLKHMLQASDHERQLIAYDIHDGLAQHLTGAIMQLDASNQLRGDNPREAAKAHDAGVLLVRQSLGVARRLISGVRPPILDESGIVAAIAHLVYEHKGQTGSKIEFHSEVEFDRLAPTLENAVYRIVQEGLTNALKYSESVSVSLGLVEHGGDLRIEVQDQGIGFDPKTVEESRYGLEGIRQRARLLGGRSLIESAPGKGTRIVVDVPIVLRQEYVV